MSGSFVLAVPHTDRTYDTPQDASIHHLRCVRTYLPVSLKALVSHRSCCMKSWISNSVFVQNTFRQPDPFSHVARGCKKDFLIPLDIIMSFLAQCRPCACLFGFKIHWQCCCSAAAHIGANCKLLMQQSQRCTDALYVRVCDNEALQAGT